MKIKKVILHKPIWFRKRLYFYEIEHWLIQAEWKPALDIQVEGRFNREPPGRRLNP